MAKKKDSEKEPDDGKNSDISELSEKIDNLEETISQVSGPYSELVGYISQLQEVSRGYFRLLNLYQTHGSISPEMVVPGLKDPMSRDIVKLLFDRKSRNISQVTEDLKKMRGTASRRIVREKLAELEEMRIVEKNEEKKTATFTISDEVVEQWAKVLGVGGLSSPKKEE